MANDLISREALLDELEEELEWERAQSAPMTATAAFKIAMRRTKKAPAVDAEPVRHGKWGECRITGYDGMHPVYTRPCSECGYESEFKTCYCSLCGAKMEEDKND